MFTNIVSESVKQTIFLNSQFCFFSGTTLERVSI